LARFRGVLQGGRGEATRLGHGTSGLRGRVEGWDCGVKVVAFVDAEGRDCFEVYETAGSNRSAADKLVLTVRG
jgi:hypothetical protein